MGTQAEPVVAGAEVEEVEEVAEPKQAVGTLTVAARRDRSARGLEAEYGQAATPFAG